jgi:hypothetical protein
MSIRIERSLEQCCETEITQLAVDRVGVPWYLLVLFRVEKIDVFLCFVLVKLEAKIVQKEHKKQTMNMSMIPTYGEPEAGDGGWEFHEKTHSFPTHHRTMQHRFFCNSGWWWVENWHFLNTSNLERCFRRDHVVALMFFHDMISLVVGRNTVIKSNVPHFLVVDLERCSEEPN